MIASPGEPRVLIVDDEPFNQVLLRGLLGDACAVRVTGAGAEALALAAAVPAPDLILLDIRLPDIDGREVCRRLKEDPLTQDIPVIFISAVDDEAEQARAFELGAVDYVTKPFNPALVRARVRLHLRLKRKTDLLAELASLDGLTEIPNRRAFDRALDEACQRALREEAPLSLAMIDVDWFKQYNDTLGHSAGDECLRRVAQQLERVPLAKDGLVGRYGGEEFGAVLPGVAGAGAAACGEALRAAVATLAIEHPCSPLRVVSVSVGVATLSAGWPAQGDLLLAADQALYRAKRRGRNRVETAAAP